MQEAIIKKWQNRLGIEHWDIAPKQINPQAVTYADDCLEKDRYFIGVSTLPAQLIATIYHDRILTEEDILHELLHVKNPDWSEDQVNAETEILLKQNKDERRRLR